MSGAPDEIKAELTRLNSERARLEAERAERVATEAAQLKALEVSRHALEGRLDALELEQREVRDRTTQMEAERKVVLTLRKHSWKVVQNLVRGVLVGSALLGMLLLSIVPEFSFGLKALLFVGGLAAAWFLGDLADYLELTAHE